MSESLGQLNLLNLLRVSWWGLNPLGYSLII